MQLLFFLSHIQGISMTIDCKKWACHVWSECNDCTSVYTYSTVRYRSGPETSLYRCIGSNQDRLSFKCWNSNCFFCSVWSSAIGSWAVQYLLATGLVPGEGFFSLWIFIHFHDGSTHHGCNDSTQFHDGGVNTSTLWFYQTICMIG